MNRNIPKCSAIAGIGLMALGLSGALWAEGCIDSDPKYPLASKLTTFVDSTDSDTYVAPSESIPAPSVTAFDGNLTCDSTSGYFGGIIPNSSGEKTFIAPDGITQFTVTSQLINGVAVWQVIPDEFLPGGGIELRGIDATISASNKGSKGCNTTFGVDAGSGRSAYEKSNGSFVASDLFVCANTTVDSVPAPQPPPAADIEGCVLQNGEDIVIYGVTIQCSGVPAGEQRTVYIAKDTEADEHGSVEPVPGFGFTNDDGVIDFSNVCICNGPAPVDAVKQCDPNPNQPDDPVTDALDPCTVTDAYPPLEILIMNSRCTTYGGSRRCY